MNLHKIAPYIFRGSRPKDIHDIELLCRNSICVIFSLQEGWSRLFHRFDEQEAAWKNGISFRKFGLSNIFPPSPDEVDMLLEKLTYCADEQIPVFFHCYAGVDRTGYIAACYRVSVEGWAPALAWEECLNFGFHNTRYWWWKKHFLKYCKKLT